MRTMNEPTSPSFQHQPSTIIFRRERHMITKKRWCSRLHPETTARTPSNRMIGSCTPLLHASAASSSYLPPAPEMTTVSALSAMALRAAPVCVRVCVEVDTLIGECMRWAKVNPAGSTPTWPVLLHNQDVG